MLRFDVVTLFPDLVHALTQHGIAARALSRGLFALHTWNPRRWGSGVHQAVDDRPYGGGPGMVMQYAPLAATLSEVRAATPESVYVLALTPQGRPLTQAFLRDLAVLPRVALVCGRYEGIDERLLRTQVDAECSIGDYVLSGGELAAMVLMDGCIRLLPGALGHDASAQEDSFTEGLLDHPHYTRPESVDGHVVPEVLLSGHHAHIQQWRRREALGRTWERRPDLLARRVLSDDEQQWLDEYRVEQARKTMNNG